MLPVRALQAWDITIKVTCYWSIDWLKREPPLYWMSRYVGLNTNFESSVRCGMGFDARVGLFISLWMLAGCRQLQLRRGDNLHLNNCGINCTFYRDSICRLSPCCSCDCAVWLNEWWNVISANVDINSIGFISRLISANQFDCCLDWVARSFRGIMS